MEITDPDKTISLKITQFPNNLIIPGVDNRIHFQAVNSFNKKAFFRFNFEGENLKVGVPAELKEGNIIEFGPGEAKNFQVALAPIIDGQGKLVMYVNWMKAIEYTVKVKKVREKIPKSLLGKIFKQVETLHISKFTDIFSINEYIEEMPLKELEKIEKEYTSKNQEYKALSLQKQNIITGKRSVKIKGVKLDDGMSIEEIDGKKLQILNDNQEFLRKLAKGYVYNNDIQKSLKYASELMDEKEKEKYYYGLIRAYGSMDLDKTINLIKDIDIREKKNTLIRSVAFDQIKRDLEQAPKLAYLIRDPNLRQNLIFDIIGNSISINPIAAIKISTLITDDLKKVNILFNIARELYEKNMKSDVTNLLNQVISIMEKSTQYNLSEKNFNNQGYVFYRNAICALVELDSPHAVDTLLVGFNLREVKDKVSEDLFDVIYEMVDEIRNKMEPSPVHSQYYLFNTLISNIDDSLKNFSKYGGNISRNVLKNEFNFNIIFLSLFSYDFSIFPIIDRIYSDLKQNLGKSFAYYIFPSKKNHNQSELMAINNTLSQFFASNLKKMSRPVLIFNLDFIPYAGKPTIILSSDTEISNKVNTALMKSLGDTANLIIDEPLFKGGTTLENLKQLFPPNMCEIFNLILSYEFISEINVFKQFIQSFL